MCMGFLMGPLSMGNASACCSDLLLDGKIFSRCIHPSFVQVYGEC